MKRVHPTLKNAIVLIACAAAIWLGAVSPAANKTYELRPDIPTNYQNPNSTIMVLDAYERLTDNYMSLVQSNLHAMAGDVTQSTKTLVEIDRKLENLTVRIARIERALNLQAVPGTSSAGDIY